MGQDKIQFPKKVKMLKPLGSLRDDKGRGCATMSLHGVKNQGAVGFQKAFKTQK